MNHDLPDVLEIILQHHLTPQARLLWLRLGAYARSDDGVAFPSQARLAEDLGITDESVRLRTRELEEAGFLRVVRNAGELLPDARACTHGYLRTWPGREHGVDDVLAGLEPKLVWGLG